MVEVEGNIMNSVPLGCDRLERDKPKEHLVSFQKYLLHLLNFIDCLKVSAELLSLCIFSKNLIAFGDIYILKLLP